MMRQLRNIVVFTIALLLVTVVHAQVGEQRAPLPVKAGRETSALDAYVGEYFLPANRRHRRIFIIKARGKLIAKRLFSSPSPAEAEWNGFELFTHSKDKFIHKFRDGFVLSITFFRDKNGHVPKLYEYVEHDPDPANANRSKGEFAERVSPLIPYVPSLEELMKYLGSYKDDRTGDTVSFTTDGVELLVHAGMQTASLFPHSRDRFIIITHAEEDRSVTFIRGGDGKITHLVFENEKGQKTKFTKM